MQGLLEILSWFIHGAPTLQRKSTKMPVEIIVSTAGAC